MAAADRRNYSGFGPVAYPTGATLAGDIARGLTVEEAIKAASQQLADAIDYKIFLDCADVYGGGGSSARDDSR